MNSRPIRCIALCLLGTLACSPVGGGRITHVVVVWLKEPGNEAHRRQVIEETRKLGAIPGIRSLDVGPCLKSERPIVDSGFDVAITITFDSVADMNAYVRHPAHEEMVRTKLKPLVSTIRVFDFQSAP